MSNKKSEALSLFFPFGYFFVSILFAIYTLYISSRAASLLCHRVNLQVLHLAL